MVNLRKYNGLITHFFVSIFIFLLISCGSQSYQNTKIEGKKIGVTPEFGETKAINDFIAPYKDHINKDLDHVLSYAPETMDKSKGEWQTTIGNLMAEMTMEMGNPVFNKKTGKNLDICLLNHGGIRAILPKGNVTTRNAFEIMPFENSLIVIELKGIQIREMAQYMLKEKKPHPLTGMKIIANKSDLTIKTILINNKPLDDNANYFVGTSDYLSNGGDRMDFFKKGIQSYDMEYKLRNLMIDYFKKTPSLPIIKTERVVLE
ncbi:5'-nucleotidase [Flavobacterium sp.]|uniref:5'-nucleotidase n=1 Tax=Flavobacterium sp. TaxID=239 RepID=UPI0028BF0D73|nr:5'-nucleotidase [Flavobacterium sp.]